MLQIGNLYLQYVEGQARLCADITLNGRGTTLWFGVEESQADYLCLQRSDAFVLALLPTAMRGGYSVTCETPMSQRLHYQLENYLIPSLCAAGELYHPVSIQAPLASEPIQNKGGVGTGFSGGVDCLYTIMTHSEKSTYPLTHLALFNVGVFEGPGFREGFRKSCRNAQKFADEMGLELVGLDSNISQVLPERYIDVVTFRLLAGAMALQGLFSTYLISSSRDFSEFSIDLHNCGTFDLLTLHCSQTESLKLYSAGGQTHRMNKLAALADWEPAQRWLHPCIYGHVGQPNCSRCKKCIADMLTLYAYGKLHHFDKVFDVSSFERALPQRIGFVLATPETRFNSRIIQLFRERKIHIPPAAYAYAEQFQKALENLKETQK